MGKARRGRRRTITRSALPPGRPRLDHWRADGAPKAVFRTQDDANRASLRLRLEEGADLDPYQCGFCRGWHLGGRSL